MTSPVPAPADASRLYPSRPLLAVSMAVFRDGRVLLIARAKAPFASTYTLPGGLVELGETLEEACRREVEEETGVSAEVLAFNRFVPVIERDAETRVRRHFVIASFVGIWRAGEAGPSAEAAEAIWAAPQELSTLSTTPRLAEVVSDARRLLGAPR